MWPVFDSIKTKYLLIEKKKEHQNKVLLFVLFPQTIMSAGKIVQISTAKCY